MSIWETLLETATHAPSPHNVQPWRVRVLSDDKAELLIEKRRTLPKEDPTGSFIILTMGLFIEALSIVAANRSLKLNHEFFQSLTQFTPEHIEETETELLPFARLTLSRRQDQTAGAGDEHSAQYDDALFSTRRTSRLSFSPERVPDEAVQVLANLARAWGHQYEQVSEPETIEQILERNIAAVFEDLNAPEYHDEIVEWFRFSDRTSQRTHDGLDYRCMNASRSSFWLAARFPKLMQLPIARPLLQRIYRRQLGTVPTIGMLAGPFWEPESAFESGRFLMRFWLELAKHNLFIHPYGNLVTNKPAAQWCRQTLGVADTWLIFKIGFSKTPPKSYRRSVREVLVD